VGFRQAIIDVGTQCMQGDFSLYLFFRARNFRAAQAPANHDANALGIGTHGLLHRLLHRAPERNALFQLFGDAATYQVSIQFRLANFDDVQSDAFPGLRLQRRAQFIDLLAALADHDAWPGSMNSDRHLVGSGALDLDTRDPGVGKLLMDGLAQLQIFLQQFFVIALSVPARLPALHDAEPETSGMYLVSQ
jgi:hypothetical protein